MLRLGFLVLLLLLPLELAAQAISKEEVWAAEIAQLVSRESIFTPIEEIDSSLRGAAFFESLDRYFSALDDRSSRFIPNLADFKQGFEEGTQVGIGISLTRTKGKCCSFSTLPDGPAARAGLPPTGVLRRVDERDITEFSLAALASVLDAPRKAQISLGYSNNFQAELKRVEVTPAAIELEGPKLITVGDYSIITIPLFRSEARFKVEALLAKVPESQPLIIDLRGTPGGSTRSATRIACLFIRKDAHIFNERVSGGMKNRVCRFSAVPGLKRRKLILLQNKQTASSAELFIAALNHSRGAITVGETTYGKGVKSKLFRLSNGAGLLLSISEYLTADGKTIHGHGITPDYPLQDWSTLESHLKKIVSELK